MECSIELDPEFVLGLCCPVLVCEYRNSSESWSKCRYENKLIDIVTATNCEEPLRWTPTFGGIDANTAISFPVKTRFAVFTPLTLLLLGCLIYDNCWGGLQDP